MRIATETLKRFPYTPEHWRARCEILLKLGFPELAAGDVYKAIVLINYVFDGGDFGSKVWLEMGMSIWYSSTTKVMPQHIMSNLSRLPTLVGVSHGMQSPK